MSLGRAAQTAARALAARQLARPGQQSSLAELMLQRQQGRAMSGTLGSAHCAVLAKLLTGQALRVQAATTGRRSRTLG